MILVAACVGYLAAGLTGAAIAVLAVILAAFVFEEAGR